LACQMSSERPAARRWTLHWLFRIAIPLLTCLVLIGGCAAPVGSGTAASSQQADGFWTWLDLRPVPPLHSVGMLAPFEGLDRRAGYRALGALRSAIAAAPSHAALLPLALDTSRDAGRAARKMMLDPSVVTVLGPLAPKDLPGDTEAEALHALGGARWIAAFSVTPRGFVAPDDPTWLQALLAGAADLAQAQGSSRLVIAGIEPDTAFAALSASAEAGGALPILWSGKFFADLEADGLAPESGTAILWLGDGAGAARQVAELRRRGNLASVWLAPWAADEVFGEHLTAAGPLTGLGNGLYSLAWQDGAHATWAAQHPQIPPELYAVDAAAEQVVMQAVAAAGENALEAIGSAGTSETGTPAEDTWRLVGYHLDLVGHRRPVNP